MSKNLKAFKDGRITKRDFDRMAVYKYLTYDNGEDLDMNEDYSAYDLELATPRFTYTLEGETMRDMITDVWTLVEQGHVAADTMDDALRDAYWTDDVVKVHLTTTHCYWIPTNYAGGCFLQLEERMENTDGIERNRVEVYDYYVD